MTVESKLCFECKQIKPAVDFYPHPQHRDGLSTRCRECTALDMHRRWRAKHPEQEAWVMPTEKICTRCKELKPIDAYTFTPASRDGRSSDCRACRSILAKKWNQANKKRHAELSRQYNARHPDKVADRNLLNHYDLPRGTYAKMLAAQDGKCAICGTTNPGNQRPYRPTRRFAVDHCHDTRVVRGLLCNNCNRGLGNFKHSIDALVAAANYLKLPPGTGV